VSIPLFLYGSGGHAREIHALVEAINGEHSKYEVLGWLDDRSDARGESLLGLPLIGRIEEVVHDLPSGFEVVIAIGSSPARRRIAERLTSLKIEFPVLIHPSAQIGPRVAIGPGTMVCAGAIITADVKIGSHAILNTGAIVSHDANIHDFATIAAGSMVAGGVEIHEGAEIGIGASILPGMSVGHWSVVGAGACVTKPVPPNATVVGVPGKTIRLRDEGWHRS